MALPGFTAPTRPMIVNSATFFMALSTVGAAPRCDGVPCWEPQGRPAPVRARAKLREPKGRAFLERSGREEPPSCGGEKSPNFDLRAAPATIGKRQASGSAALPVDE